MRSTFKKIMLAGVFIIVDSLFSMANITDTLPALNMSLNELSKSLQKPTQATLVDAIKNKDTSTIRNLLQQGANPNTIYTYLDKERTPFMDAIFTHDIPTIKLLIEFGANVNIKIPPGSFFPYTPLDIAVTGGFARSPFFKPQPVSQDELDVITLLLNNGATITFDTLTRAIDRRDLQLLGLLLDHPNDQERKQIFEQKGTYGDTALDEAIKTCNTDIVNLFITKGAQLSSTSLLHAVDCQNDQMLKWLLDHGADPNARDDQGKTPLMEAALREKPGMVNILLQHKADVNLTDKGGKTAVDYAPSGSYIRTQLRDLQKK